MNPSESVNIFTTIAILIIFGCFVLSCCGYILSQREYRKRRQIQLINHCSAPEAQEQVFTIEMPCTQPSNYE